MAASVAQRVLLVAVAPYVCWLISSVRAYVIESTGNNNKQVKMWACSSNNKTNNNDNRCKPGSVLMARGAVRPPAVTHGSRVIFGGLCGGMPFRAAAASQGKYSFIYASPFFWASSLCFVQK